MRTSGRRLAPTLEAAQPELTVLGATAATAFRDTDEHLEPRIVAYIDSIFGGFSHLRAMVDKLRMACQP